MESTINSIKEKYTLNKEQENVLNVMTSGVNMFLTGQAGTGKSYLIKVYTKWCNDNDRIIARTSTTGISALLIKGSTIHSWAGIGLGDLEASELLRKVQKNYKASKRWKETDVLILDEVSMLTPDLLVKLEFIARTIRWSGKPFGGIQVILVGDFCQLPPVKTDVFAFESPVWDKIIQGNIFYLKTNMRQSDPTFQDLLARVRMGVLVEKDRKLLLSRLTKDNSDNNNNNNNNKIRPTKLYSHRRTAEDINKNELTNLISDENGIRRYHAKDNVASQYKIKKKTAIEYVERLNKNSQARPRVDLCIGAQVMLIYNIDAKAGLVNGSRGVVTKFEEQRPVVQFMNGIETIVQSIEWEFIINDNVTIVRKQIPLILAWSYTVHKSQGCSLDCVELDLGDTIFAHGQAYTALSRVRTIKGLRITDLNFKKITVDPKVEEFYMSLETDNLIID